jgi:hypothetical protein
MAILTDTAAQTVRTVLANTRQLWGSRREEAPSDAIPGMGSLFRSPSLAIKLCLYLTVFKTLGSGEAWNGTGSRDAPSLRSMWDRLVRTPITFTPPCLGRATSASLEAGVSPPHETIPNRCRQCKPRQLTTLSQRSSSTPLSVRTWAVMHSNRVPVNTRRSVADVRRTQNHSLRVKIFSEIIGRKPLQIQLLLLFSGVFMML